MTERKPYAGESERRSKEVRRQYGGSNGYANGGRVSGYPRMQYGSGSGEGRLEKTADSGMKPQKGSNT